MSAASTSHKEANSRRRGATAAGLRGSMGVLGVRILNFFGGLARSVRGPFAASETTDVADTLVSCAYGHLAANTPQNRQLAWRFLAMAATIYRDGGKTRRADEMLTMLRQVQGPSPLEHTSVGSWHGNRDRKDRIGQ